MRLKFDTTITRYQDQHYCCIVDAADQDRVIGQLEFRGETDTPCHLVVFKREQPLALLERVRDVPLPAWESVLRAQDLARKLIEGPHPEAAAIRTAMDLLERTVKGERDLGFEPVLNQGSYAITRYHTPRFPACQTIACHGGWYAIAKMEGGPEALWTDSDGDVDFPTDMSTLVDENRLPIQYNEGAELLAKDLGFDGPDSLCVWARENADLWGNSTGDFMFSPFNKPFGKPHEDTTIDDVIAHWRGVADRVEWLPR